MKLLSVGFGNYVASDRILAILNPDSAPMKRLKEEIKSKGLLIDVTQGRRTRAFIALDSGHLVLSGIQADTLATRYSNDSGKKE
ncbi:DUF370 domain-containing protein [bacterium]|nr:DUF370 domain-containing protein [candidate division CSSED10-310 bacterium]